MTEKATLLVDGHEYDFPIVEGTEGEKGHRDPHRYVHGHLFHRPAAGWIARWREQDESPDFRISRPRQIYSGNRETLTRRCPGPADGSHWGKAISIPARRKA